MPRVDMSEIEDRHAFQVRMCERFGKPVLNVACQEDPAFLGEKFDAENVDMRESDLFLDGVEYTRDLRNFQMFDARHLPATWTERFQTTVLGEFLEHCDFDYAATVLRECVRCTKVGGVVVLTFPFDDRKPEEQHEASKLFEPVKGYTTYHRTIWKDDMLERLFLNVGNDARRPESRLVEVIRCDLDYFFGKPLKGLGIVVRKL